MAITNLLSLSRRFVTCIETLRVLLIARTSVCHRQYSTVHTNDRIVDEKSQRKRLVILGTGWGSYSVLKKIDKKKFDAIVISPRNHFLFTPLLASTTVGTLEFRSIIEPVRYLGQLTEDRFELKIYMWLQEYRI